MTFPDNFVCIQRWWKCCLGYWKNVGQTNFMKKEIIQKFPRSIHILLLTVDIDFTAVNKLFFNGDYQ